MSDPGSIDLGGRRLAFNRQGDGAPTVVLEAGLATESGDWQPVADGVAAFTRVLWYDRAGRGASDPAPRPRSAAALVDDLHALLHMPGVRDGPVVLVGHSFGGLLVRLYAHRHRRDVAALVLVESMHEDQFATLGPAFSAASDGESPALTAMRAFWTGGWRDPSGNPEGVDLAASLDEVRAAAALDALPLCVLSAGSFLGRELFAPPDGERLQALWGGLQNRLAALSSDVEQVLVESSGHFMQHDAPQVVVQTVQRLVERLRP